MHLEIEGEEENWKACSVVDCVLPAGCSQFLMVCSNHVDRLLRVLSSARLIHTLADSTWSLQVECLRSTRMAVKCVIDNGECHGGDGGDDDERKPVRVFMPTEAAIVARFAVGGIVPLTPRD